MLAFATPVIRLVAPGSVGLGHEGGALLVAREDELDAGRLLQGHHEVGILFSGDAEDVLDALFLKAADQQIGGLHERFLGGGSGTNGSV